MDEDNQVGVTSHHREPQNPHGVTRLHAIQSVQLVEELKTAIEAPDQKTSYNVETIGVCVIAIRRSADKRQRNQNLWATNTINGRTKRITRVVEFTGKRWTQQPMVQPTELTSATEPSVITYERHRVVPQIVAQIHTELKDMKILLEFGLPAAAGQREQPE
jgi:hypothetical protein